MKILILGGGRFIGRRIAEWAAEAGHQVSLFNRGQSWPEAPFHQIRGELDELEAHQEEFNQLAPDAVVHCIAYTPTDAERFVKVFAPLSVHAVVLSSADCYEAFQGLNRGEERSDFPVDENSPTAQQRFYWRDLGPQKMTDYDKNLVTDTVFAGLENCTVLRLPMVYGPHDLQFAHRHGSIIRRIYDREKNYALGMGRQHCVWHFGYIDNVAAAVVHALQRRECYGQVYNIGESQVRSWRRWVQLYGEVAEHAFDVQLLPDPWLDENHTRNAPPLHFWMDCSRFRRETGFQAPVSLSDAIRATLDWGLEHPDSLGQAPNYVREAQLIQDWRRLANPTQED